MKSVTVVTLLLLVVSAVSFFVMFGPPKLMAKTSEPAYCASCHVMKPEYEAWFHGGPHRNIKCVDCHLPNENKLLHYVWKSREGMRDMLAFYSGDLHGSIAISGHGKEVVQKNCIRCHAQRVSNMDKSRQCWGCHRRMAHITPSMRLTNL